MECSKNNGLSVIDGVYAWTDESGKTHFKPCNQKNEKIQPDTRNWLQKLLDWWKDSKIKPYVKIRDAADPFGDRTDPDAGCDGKTGIETGIKITF